MQIKVKRAAEAHALKEYPKEACGLIIDFEAGLTYFPCKNDSITANDTFIINPQDWSDAEETGEIVGIVHSHPDASGTPSEADRRACNASGLSWHIVGLPALDWHYMAPEGLEMPLIGRVFKHGTVDCYSLVKDYYGQEMGISLPDFHRYDDWWKSGGNLYDDNFHKAGFHEVSDLQVGDVILMSVLSDVSNHAAVYLGDDFIIHHLYNRLSCREALGGYRKFITKILRHGSKT